MPHTASSLHLVPASLAPPLSLEETSAGRTEKCFKSKVLPGLTLPTTLLPVMKILGIKPVDVLQRDSMLILPNKELGESEPWPD